MKDRLQYRFTGQSSAADAYARAMEEERRCKEIQDMYIIQDFGRPAEEPTTSVMNTILGH